MGGALQGIAQALYEEAIYDEAGNLVTSNLAFYYVPTAAEAPRYEVYFAEEPHPSRHPTGTKGIGEAATIASTPAVVMAVEDAMRRVKPGVRIDKTPITPEDVWRLLR